MTEPLTPGQTGEPLPSGEIVFRLAKHSKDSLETGKVSAAQFILSESDETSYLKSLSVWAKELTTPQQAQAFMTSNREAYVLAAYLDVDTVRAIRPSPDSPDVANLDVVWDRLMVDVDGLFVTDPRPGADGHAGIVGLMRPKRVEKIYYKSIRAQLAELSHTVVFGMRADHPSDDNT